MFKALVVLGLIVLAIRVARFIRDVRADAAYLEAHRTKKEVDSVYKRNIRARAYRKKLYKEWTGGDL